jgi:hypothetical protein
MDDVVRFPGRTRPLSKAEALEAIRRAGSVESVMALAGMLGWERTKLQRTLARWEGEARSCASRYQAARP